MRIRPLAPSDVDEIAAAFAAVRRPGKGVELFQRYLAEQAADDRVVLLAEVDGGFAGYICVIWRSGYGPFRAEDIPEIQDFNILPSLRRRGIATALMDAAESAIAQRSPVAGLGCGLYADYGAAMRLYIGRGYLPDGRGVAYGGQTIAPGDTIRVDDSAELMFTKRLGSA
jgi:GNAT superfamily N-acetyltransferase